MEKPNIRDYGLTAYFPLTKQKRLFAKDRESYEVSLLDEHEQEIYKIRTKQLMNINGLSVCFISFVTILWGLYYQISFFQNHFSFMSLSLAKKDPDWADHVTLFIIPSVTGTVLHKLPNFIPWRKARFILNIAIKLIPVLLLIICCYLPKTEKEIYKIKKSNKIKGVSNE